MATSLKELIVTYTANAQPVLQALDQIDAKIKNTAQNLKATSQSFMSVGRDLSLAITAPLTLLAGGALRASANFETLKMQMEVLTGSAAEGERVFQRLVKFAAETPFELNELAKATTVLMGYGESADDAYNHLKLLGDVAAVSGGDFAGITLAFGQASAAGKIMGIDLLQLVNNGVPAIKLLSEEMGVPKEQIKDLVSQGKVSFPILVRALERATRKGGMFEGGMEKLSKTSKGVWSTFKDNVNIALAKFGDEMQKAFNLTGKLEKFGNWIGKLAENFQRLYPETKRNIFLFLGLIAVLGPLLLVIGTLIRLASLVALGFAAILAPIRLLITTVPILMAVIRAFFLVFAANPLGAFIAATLAIFYYWKDIVDFFKQAYEWISKISLTGAWDKVKDFTANIKTKIMGEDKIQDVVNNIKADISPYAKNSIGELSSNSLMNNQKTVQNNLTVNIPAGMSSVDSLSIKDAVKAALAEENRQAYLEVATQ